MKHLTDARRLEQLLEVTRKLATPLALPDMLEQVIEAARAVLDADRGTVFLYDRDSDELVLLVGTGLVATRFPATQGLAGDCAQSRQVVNVPDAYADSRFNREIDRKTGYRTRCVLTVPLVGLEDDLVGVLQLLNKHGGVFTAEDESVATVLAAQCAVAIQRVRMVEQLLVKEKMDRELELAREIQTSLLPHDVKAPAGYDVIGLSRPAERTGGDTFDLIPRGERALVLLLGDATGHGVGPALTVTQVRAMLRFAVRTEVGLDDGFRHINDQLAQDLAANRFITAFFGVLDGEAHEVRYHSAGQGPLLHFHAANGACDWLEPTTFPMGLMKHDPPHRSSRLALAPGDVLALITDGVYETENAEGEMFGHERVGKLVRDGVDGPMADLGRELLQRTDVFRGGAAQDDDVTIVLVRRLPSGEPHA